MTRKFALCSLVVLFGFAVCLAADNLIAGKWDCVSDDGSGQKTNSTLVVAEDGGKLSGTLNVSGADIPLVDPKLDGNTFTFKLVINSNCTVETKVTIDGNKFEGKFSCPEASGIIKGTKQS
jgi:hypothetical protein